MNGKDRRRVLIPSVPFGQADPASLAVLKTAGADYVLNPLGRRPTEEELAEMIGWSPNHYSMRFRQIVGHSPLEYLIHHRLERASQLLRSTNLRIAEIAYRVGFSSMSYFARRFRRVYGLTPHAFREVHVDQWTAE